MGPIFWPDPTLLCRFLFLRYSTFINNSVPLKYGLGVTRGHWKRHHSINCEEFLLAYHSNSMALPCTFSEIKQDIGRKSRFLQPTCVRGSLSEYYNNVWYGKTRMAVLWDGENSLRTCLLFSIQYTNVIDRQTDKRTERHCIAALCTASRGKNHTNQSRHLKGVNN